MRAIFRVVMVLFLACVAAAGLVYQSRPAWAAPCCSSCDARFDRCVDSCLAQGTPISICFQTCGNQVLPCYQVCNLSC